MRELAEEVRRKDRAPRDDGFFDAHATRTSDGEALLEAVLRQAAFTYDERKLPFLARFYAAVAYDPSVPSAAAYALVRELERLTYEQLVAISVFANHAEHLEGLEGAQADQDERRPKRDPTAEIELYDLVDRRLLGIGTDTGAVALGNDLAGVVPSGGSPYSGLRLLPSGELLARLSGADAIKVDERRRWIERLSANNAT